MQVGSLMEVMKIWKCVYVSVCPCAHLRVSYRSLLGPAVSLDNQLRWQTWPKGLNLKVHGHVVCNDQMSVQAQEERLNGCTLWLMQRHWVVPGLSCPVAPPPGENFPLLCWPPAQAPLARDLQVGSTQRCQHQDLGHEKSRQQKSRKP